MTRKEFKQTREELYNLVWEKPLTKLAPQYGLSDNGLRKICLRHKIPLPKAGYWAKLLHGGKSNKPSLSTLTNKEDQYLNKIIIQGKENSIKSEDKVDPIFNEIYEFESSVENKITVKEKLTSPHNLIKTTKAALNGKRLDRYSRIITKNQECLDIKVTRGTYKRALLILDVLIKSLEKRSFVQEVYIKNNPSFAITILDKDLRIILKEKINRLSESKKIKYKSDKNDSSYLSMFNYDLVDYEGTGELSLSIEGGWGTTCKKTWADTSAKPLEDSLNEFIIGLARTAAELIPIDNQRELEELRRREEHNRRLELERQKLFEEEMFNCLIKDARKHNDLLMLKKYIADIENNLGNDNFDNKKNFDMKEWLNWAKCRLAEHDPSMNFDFITYDEFEVTYR